MMGYQNMMGGYGSWMMFSGWIVYVLIIILLALSIAALWKYLQK